MKYGELPVDLGIHQVKCNEMMFYQYLPIKINNKIVEVIYEKRLNCFNKLIGVICCDFIGTFGLNRYMDSYIYLTAKYMYQDINNSFNRSGYHSDGFMTDDINYIWSDKNPTIFNTSLFNLTQDDSLSLKEMSEQANRENECTYLNNTLLRLNQYNIHKVNDNPESGMRTFLKVSFSKDKYDLIGNSHNYELDYNWEMRERELTRNIPQKL